MHPDDFSFTELTGKVKVKRASNVEPTEDGKWQANMSPIGGEKLEKKDKRKDALKEEVEYLENRFRNGDFMEEV